MKPVAGTAAFDIDALAWTRQEGLVPAIIQDAATLRVLMLGYMDRAALSATLAEGRVSFYSRSRQAPWRKGDSSGHWLELVRIECDCDADTLLVLARPHGPTCHLERCSCFPHARMGLKRPSRWSAAIATRCAGKRRTCCTTWWWRCVARARRSARRWRSWTCARRPRADQPPSNGSIASNDSTRAWPCVASPVRGC